jgi:hypothetical protein
MFTWDQLPRKHDRIAIVGFAESRKLTPWNDKDIEFIGVNEEYHFDWFKHTPTRWLQIHPRWDFTRTNNGNHFNHPLWLFNKSGTCMKCQGNGKVKLGEEMVGCNECGETGRYTPPPYRKDTIIYMQEHWDDIPGSVRFPLKEATELLPMKYPYFTSSFAMMLSLSFLMGFKRVEMYGFEMGTQTEYHYQRANAEYLIGFFQGKGMDIYIPQESPILKGELYGYKNMKTGMRQNMEMRKVILEAQEKQVHSNFDQMTGALQLLQKMVSEGRSDMAPLLEEKSKEYMKIVGTENVIKGALAETKNLIGLYDTYFTAGIEEGKVLSAEEIQAFTNVTYRQ